MKQKIFIAGLFLGGLTANQLSAQKYLGLSHSNYSGVYGSQYNPAKLPDEKVKFAFNLVSVNALIDNNFYKFKGVNDLAKIDLNEFAKGKTGSNNTDKNITLGTIAEVLGPSAQFTTSNRLGFGISTRVRAFVQGNDIKSDFLSILNKTAGSTINSVDTKGFSFGATALADVGVKGGYAVIDNSDIKLSLGASIKYYKGVAMNSFVSKGHNLSYNNATGVITANNINWELQTNLDPNSDFNHLADNLFGGNSGGNGIGGDFGAELILKNGSNDKPYNFKFGAAIHDIGSVKYKNVSTLKITGGGPATTIDPSQIDFLDINATANYLNTRGLNVVESKGNVTQNLPTNLDIYADYAINDKFFVTANGLVNLAKTDVNNAYYYNYVGLTPRFETKWIDVAVPLSYN